MYTCEALGIMHVLYIYVCCVVVYCMLYCVLFSWLFIVLVLVVWCGVVSCVLLIVCAVFLCAVAVCCMQCINIPKLNCSPSLRKCMVFLMNCPQCQSPCETMMKASVSADCVRSVSIPMHVCMYLHAYILHIDMGISNCLCEHLCAYSIKWVCMCACTCCVCVHDCVCACLRLVHVSVCL